MGTTSFLGVIRALALPGLLLCANTIAYAQMPPGAGPSSSTRTNPLPLSGRSGQTGSVGVQQSASPGSGVSTINSSVQVSGDLSGSVPAQNAPAGPITLSLADTVRRGLEANLGPISANNAVNSARAQQVQSRSALLPNIGLNASETVTQVNLAAYGLKFNAPPGLGFSIPTVVGPYSYSQAQATLNQSILDLVSRRNWKASKETERSSVLSAKDARESVVLAVAGSYLQTVTAAARVA